MTPRSLIALGIFAGLGAGCTSKTDDSASSDDSSATNVFDEVVYLQTEVVSANPERSFECYNAGDPWLTQTPDSSCVADVPLTGEVNDFESGDGVADASLELFFDDQYHDGHGDQSAVSDSQGALSTTGRTCTPTAYSTTTDPALNLTKITIQSHEIYGFGASIDTEFNSVSTTTYNVIPSLLGISVQAGMGIVAGTAYDCEGEPIMGVQVIGRSADGTYPDQSVRYFREEFPNRDQEGTSEDGLWVAVNLPPGPTTMEMWAWNGTEHVLLGSSVLTIIPDSINIASTYLGYDEGVVYPDSCLTACQ